MKSADPKISKLDRWLVADWRQCWRWFSTHALALAVALQAAWLEMPDEMKEGLPAELVHVLTIIVLVLGFIGRLLPQHKPSETDADA